MAKPCAYCGEFKKLTREHLYAESIMRAEPGMRTFVDKVRDRVSSSSPTVKDVCEDCNNGPLSDLDGYGIALYRRYFANVSGSRVRVAFHFEEYDTLTRWLLKLLYNDTRTHGFGRDILAAFAPYIRGVAPVPALLSIYVGVVKTMRSTLREQLGGLHPRLEPHVIRYGELKEPLKPKGAAIVRSVCLKSFVFLVVVWEPDATPHDEWPNLPWVRNMKLLSPTLKAAVITKPFADSRDYLFGPEL